MASCPISNERVNERVARIVGGLVFVAALSFMFHPSLPWLVLLVVDFSARSFYRPYSLFAQMALPVAKRLGAPQIVDAAPKIFAARIGLAMAATAMALYLAGYLSAAAAIMAIMLICAFFEAAFGYCVGCKFYTIYRKLAG
ncbi:DUF4395 domain-containing protein [Hydrogenimonas urashimensis]|uniref:DUF4395 domain-containing protein n=1 Tax=Hydrogenimonas urashimensis TaxID=2740515 RepID=UPI0019161753|nr:DUF4395 domain-containing protein [Hydrogenimonas urashimensis]